MEGSFTVALSLQGAQGTWPAWQDLLEVFFQFCRRKTMSSKPVRDSGGISQHFVVLHRPCPSAPCCAAFSFYHGSQSSMVSACVLLPSLVGFLMSCEGSSLLFQYSFFPFPFIPFCHLKWCLSFAFAPSFFLLSLPLTPS